LIWLLTWDKVEFACGSGVESKRGKNIDRRLLFGGYFKDQLFFKNSAGEIKKEKNC